MQINQVVRTVLDAVGETTKRADFMLELKMMMAKSATDAELNQFVDSMERSSDRKLAQEQYNPNYRC